MKNNKLVLFPVAVGLLAVGILSAGAGILIEATRGDRGDRELITKTREVSDFTKIEFDGVADVNVRQGSEVSVVVVAPEEVQSRIKTEVDNGILRISEKKGPTFHLFSWNEYNNVSIDITVKDIKGIELNGVGEFKIDRLTTDSLTVKTSGVGDMTLRDLNAKNLTVEMEGIGEVSVSGKVEQQTVTQNGAGDYFAYDLESKRCDITLDGIGEAEVWVIEYLKADVDGAGGLTYDGEPRTDIKTSGIGEVHKR